MKSTASLNFIILLLLISCGTNQKQPPPFYAPQVVEARGYVVPADSIAAPKVTPVQKPKLVVAGKPKIVPAYSNVVPAGIPIQRLAGKPRDFGRVSFFLSKREARTESPFAAGTPEVVTATYAAIKSPNPSSFSSFGKLQGLRSAFINDLVEDTMGNLWIVNMGGLSKYDGKNFTNYTIREGLAHNLIYCMLEDKNGNLWFGTLGAGISRFDGNRFTNFTTRDGIADNTIRRMYEDKAGNIWFSTDKGLNRFDGKTFTTHQEMEGQNFDLGLCFAEDVNGNLCIGGVNGLNIFNGESLTRYTRMEGLNSDTVTCILKDTAGNLWLGELNKGVTRFDGNTFSSFTTKEGLTGNTVSCMLQDRQGNYWFGTSNRGLNKYDGKTFTHFTTKEGLSSNDIRRILEDRHGNIWVGTFDGVNKYDGKTFTHFTEIHGLSDSYIRSMAEDKNGDTWFGTWKGGANKYDGKNFSHYTMNEGMRTRAAVTMLVDKTGNMWFGDYSGISKFDGKVFTHFTEKADVWTIMQDKSGDIWFGTWGDGAFRYDGTNFTHYTQTEGLSNNYVNKVLQDKSGNLWFSTFGGGLTRFDGKNFVHFTEKTGLRDNYVRTIQEDTKGNIWIGYLNEGISKYDGKNFVHLNETNGLCNNEVRVIREDHNGNMWFGTASGVSKLERDKVELLNNIQAIKQTSGSNHYFKTYTYEDGFFGLEVTPGNAIIESKDGTIWIGTVDRLTAFHPRGERKDTIAPNVQLNGVKLYNENVNWQSYLSQKADGRLKVKDTVVVLSTGARLENFRFDELSKWYGIPGNLSLAHNNNHLTFQYVGITIRAPKKVRYQYVLEGFEDNWNAPTNRSEASYTNLPHGDYTFKVKAMNGDGYWSKEFTYSFTIRPPWWHTWWAYALFTLAATGIVYAIFRYRLNRVRREHETKQKTAALEMKALRAQMNPHFIFNSLNAINLFILENNKLQASEYLSKFSKLVRLILNNSRESFVPLVQELEALELYLELESLRFEQRFNYKITVEPGIDTSVLKVPPLIIQPYAENAIWHGLMHKKDGGNLEIHLYQQDKMLFCKIVDDGIGRKMAAELKSKSSSKRKSMGMRITADRIAILQDESENHNYISVQDIVLPDGSAGGTEVTLKIPVNYA